MPALRTLTLLASGLLASALLAQTQDSTIITGSGSDRPFAYVEGSSIHTFQGSWRSTTPLLRYAHDHTGTYIAFAQGTEIHRLDNPDRLAEVRRMYAPMQDLAAKQHGLAQAQQALAQGQQKLASTQRPLSEHQRDLAQQQRSAGTPQSQGQLGQAQGVLGEEQGYLGSAQGDLGRQQGDVGAAQGQLGRKQGEIARDIDRRLQVIFTECLANGSCPRVS